MNKSNKILDNTLIFRKQMFPTLCDHLRTFYTKCVAASLCKVDSLENDLYILFINIDVIALCVQLCTPK